MEWTIGEQPGTHGPIWDLSADPAFQVAPPGKSIISSYLIESHLVSDQGHRLNGVYGNTVGLVADTVLYTAAPPQPGSDKEGSSAERRP